MSYNEKEFLGFISTERDQDRRRFHHQKQSEKKRRMDLIEELCVSLRYIRETKPPLVLLEQAECAIASVFNGAWDSVRLYCEVFDPEINKLLLRKSYIQKFESFLDVLKKALIMPDDIEVPLTSQKDPRAP